MAPLSRRHSSEPDRSRCRRNLFSSVPPRRFAKLRLTQRLPKSHKPEHFVRIEFGLGIGQAAALAGHNVQF